MLFPVNNNPCYVKIMMTNVENTNDDTLSIIYKIYVNCNATSMITKYD